MCNITVSTTAVAFLFPVCRVTKWHHCKHGFDTL